MTATKITHAKEKNVRKRKKKQEKEVIEASKEKDKRES